MVFTGLANTWICDAQMIYDTLLLSELEILAYKADYTSSTKQQSVDSTFLQNLSHADLGEVLSSYTPVYIRSYGKGSLATASFRGTGANHTQLMWNDFRVNSPMLGQSDFSMVPTSFFDKVELYYGGASLAKSEGGLGGNICLYNKPFATTSPMVYLVQSIGSFNTYSTSAGLNLGKKKFNSDTRIIFQTAENDFTYYNDAIAPPQEMQQRNASYRNGGFTQQFHFRPNANQTISLASWTQWNHREIPPVMSKAEANKNLKEYEDDFFSRNTLAWAYHKNKTKLKVSGAWFFENYEYHQELFNDNSGQTDTIIDSQNETNGVFLKVNYTTSFKYGIALSAGMNNDYDQVKSNNYATFKSRNSTGIFVKLEKDFIERIKLSLLTRAQLTDGDMLPLMPLLGLNIKLLNKHDFYFRGSVSRNYHLPTLNDLYWNPGGNEDLGPEDGYELEGGLNYIVSPGGKLLIKADLTAYATRVNNWIQWVENGTVFWTPENISKVFSRGLECSVQIQGEAGRVNYLFYTQYAFTRTTNISEQSVELGTDAQQMIYIPEHAANAYLKLAMYGFSFDWNIHVVGEQNAVGEQLPAYILNDLSFGKVLHFGGSSFNIRCRANNIFNTDYQSVSARAMPGRNFEFIIKYNFNQ